MLSSPGDPFLLASAPPSAQTLHVLPARDIWVLRGDPDMPLSLLMFQDRVRWRGLRSGVVLCFYEHLQVSMTQSAPGSCVLWGKHGVHIRKQQLDYNRFIVMFETCYRMSRQPTTSELIWSLQLPANWSVLKDWFVNTIISGLLGAPEYKPCPLNLRSQKNLYIF